MSLSELDHISIPAFGLLTPYHRGMRYLPIPYPSALRPASFLVGPAHLLRARPPEKQLSNQFSKRPVRRALQRHPGKAARTRPAANPNKSKRRRRAAAAAAARCRPIAAGRRRRIHPRSRSPSRSSHREKSPSASTPKSPRSATRPTSRPGAKPTSASSGEALVTSTTTGRCSTPTSSTARANLRRRTPAPSSLGSY